MSNFREPNERGGTSHWLVLSACIVRITNDSSLVQRRDSITSAIGQRRRDLHFRELNHQQKVAACRLLHETPIRLINILWRKPDTENPDAFKIKHKLYWYLARYLVERITWLADETGQDTKICKLIFSNRGGMKYGDFRAYMRRLRNQETEIRWHTLDVDMIDAIQHRQRAGLQLADCAAKAFADAVEPSPYGEYEPRYAQMLRRITYSRNGRYRGYGFKVVANVDQLDDDPRNFIRDF